MLKQQKLWGTSRLRAAYPQWRFLREIEGRYGPAQGGHSMQRLEGQQWWVYRVVEGVSRLLGFVPGEDRAEALAEAERVYPEVPLEELVLERDGELLGTTALSHNGAPVATSKPTREKS